MLATLTYTVQISLQLSACSFTFDVFRCTRGCHLPVARSSPDSLRDFSLCCRV